MLNITLLLYGQCGKLWFPFTSITEEYRVVRMGEFMMVRDLSDPVVKNALPEKKARRKKDGRKEYFLSWRKEDKSRGE